MNKFILLVALIFSLNITAQVGIGTTTPRSTLDVPSSDVNTPTNTDGVLIPRVRSFAATNPTALQEAMLVFLTRDITGYNKGFHYWDNTRTDWIPINNSEWKDGTNSNGDQLIYAAQARSNSVDIVVTDDGKIGFGTDNPIERLELKGPGDNDFQITSASTNPPNLIFYNTGGTLDAPTALTSTQEIGSVIMKTHDGNNIVENGGFRFYMDGVVTPGSAPSRFIINTTPRGSTTQQQRISVRENGNVGISEANPTATLHLRAGTNTANSAPLKLTPGTNLNTPENGAMEFDGSELYYTRNTNREIVLSGYKSTRTINFATINRNSVRENSFTVTGARLGMSCACSPRGAIENNLIWSCYVSAANTVVLRLANISNSSINPGNRVWNITVLAD